MLKVVNAMGDACPIPVVKTKNAIKELSGAGMVETLVDNEIAVQNLTKMAQQKNYGVRSEKLLENQYGRDLCRTQVLLQMKKPEVLSEYFLRKPIGNHHIVFSGSHRALFEAFMHEI